MRAQKNFKYGNENYKGGYLLISFFTLLIYIGTIASYIQFNNKNLPVGDPFTYTVGYFRLLDLSHAHYFKGLEYALRFNFYWLINFFIALFSPFLIKEPFSLCLVNFIVWGLATASFYRLGVYLKLGFTLSILSSLIIWIYPINFGFLDHTSIPVLGLDAIFLGILQVAIANIIVYYISPTKTHNAIIAGISVGLAIWGRGNSLPVVLLIIIMPLALIIYKIVIHREQRKYLLNFLLFLLLSLGMAAYFYYRKSGSIFEYYRAHLAFVQRQHWNLSDAMPYIKNVPGFFFWRVENSPLTIILSWLSNIVVLSSILQGIRKIRGQNLEYISFVALVGGFIYFATFFINIILFTDPLMNIYNCLLIYAPMRIGFSLCLISILANHMIKKNFIFKPFVAYWAVVFIFVSGTLLTRLQIPKVVPERPLPSSVESFSKNINNLVGSGSISILWYGNYNAQIMNYYRLKNDLAEIKLYKNKYFNDIWNPFDYSEEKRRKVKEEIGSHFKEASIIIIPEYLDYYWEGGPYSLYVFRNEIADFLNSKESPRFVVIGLIKEHGTRRLMVLKRKNEANGLSEPLKLPYTVSTEPHSTDYGTKVLRHSLNMQEIDF